MQTVLLGGGALLLVALLAGAGLIAERLLQRSGPLHRSLVCRATLVSIVIALPLYLVGVWLPTEMPLPIEVTPPAPSAWVVPKPDPFHVGSGAAVSVEPTHLLPPTPLRPQSSAPMRPFFRGFLSPEPRGTPTLPANSLLLTYAAVVGLRVLWLGFAYAGTCSLRRRSSPSTERTPDVSISDHIPSAVLVGIFRPRILVPRGFFTDFAWELQTAILTHERTHRARRDPLWNLAFRTTEAIFWPVFLLGLLRKRHTDASEEIADRAALASGTTPRVYADCLLTLAERRAGGWLAAGIGSDGPQIARRVEALLSGRAWKPVPPRLPLVFGLAAFLLACPPTFFASRVLAARQVEAWEGDDRLNQIVSVTAEGIALADLLPLVSQKTGVPLRAETSIADEKVIVFSKGRPLRETLGDIAALFQYRWRETKDSKGQTAYRLEAPGKTRAYEERLAGEDRDYILSRLNELVRALSESPEQVKARKADDPIRLMLEHGRIGVELYARLTPAQQAQMVDTGRARLPVAGLTPAQKKTLAPYFYEGDQFTDDPQLLPSADGAPLSLNGITPIRPDKMDRTSLSFELMVAQMVAQNEGEQRMSVTMRAPTGLALPLASFPAPDAFALPPHGNPYDGSKVDPKTLPDVPDGKAWIDRLKALAEKSGHPVVADFYRSRTIHVGSASELEKLSTPASKLDALCVPGGNLWWTGGKTLFFRKRDWYRQKQYEVSDKWRVETARQWAVHGGKLRVSDLQPLTRLTLKQIVGLQDGAQDERNTGGLAQVLRLVTLTAAPGAPIYSEVENNLPYRTFLVPLSDLRYAALLAEFADAYTYPDLLLDADPNQFGINIGTVTSPLESKIKFDWALQTTEGGRTTGGSFQVPLTLPDDRRDKTQVTLP